jgi:hypothetical protein
MPRLSFGIAVVLVLASACSSSKPPTGKTCTLNTDCNNPLACSYGRCHDVCRETRDCPTGQRCIKSQSGNVCQLDDEKRCPSTGMCQQPLICAIDLLCHNSCTTPADCPLNQMCASSACAEPGEVGSDGKLKPAPDGGVATGGSGGGSGTGGAGGMGGADSGVDAPPSGTIGPCGVPEMEPNDKRENATPIAAPAMFTACIGTPDDVDFYELTAPNDVTGGYYFISLTGITGWTAQITAFTALDSGELGLVYASSDGQDLNAYLAALPGQKYRLQINGFISVGKAPAKYDVKLTYTKVEDAQEPNPTKDSAKMISLGTPLSAYMFRGLKALPAKEVDVADWYQVTATAGNVTATVEMVPANMSAYVQIFDPTGKESYGYSGNDGANATATSMNGPAGTYFISVHPWSVRPVFFFGQASTPTDVPDNYLHPYKLTVSQ